MNAGESKNTNINREVSQLKNRFPFLEIRWVQHLLFWFAILLFASINWRVYNVPYHTEVMYNLLHLSVCALVIYFNFYFLMPRFLLQGKFLIYGVTFLLSMIAGTYLGRVLLFYIMPYLFPFTQRFPWATKSFLDFHYFIYCFAAMLSVVTFTFVIKLSKMWYQKENSSRILQKEKLEAELKFLKNQINPHFFFNTLNNLYALTLKKSDAAPAVVLKLSSLMDYLLHESNVPFMLLKKEIEILNNYIELEKIRHDEGFNVSFHVNGNIANHRVAPLLFLPFVENAFKHGMGSAPEETWINVELSVEDNLLFFKVENSKSPQPISDIVSSGIGLQNVQKRLALIYKDQYDLQFFNEEDTFLVVLKIELQKTELHEG